MELEKTTKALKSLTQSEKERILNDSSSLKFSLCKESITKELKKRSSPNKEEESCTFRPQINSNSEILSKRTHTDDYMVEYLFKDSIIRK